jgi:serine/threonine protein kinase
MRFPDQTFYNQACLSRSRFTRLKSSNYRFVRNGPRYLFSGGAFACIMKVAQSEQFKGVAKDPDVQRMIQENPSSCVFAAIRFFTRDQPGLLERYRSLSDFLDRTPSLSPLLLSTSFWEAEVNHLQGADADRDTLEKDKLLPVLKMDWCSGLPLGQFVAECCKRGDSSNLAAVRSLLAGMAQEFRRAGFVHGDLSPENILIVESQDELQLKLVDYDSVLFSGIEHLPSSVGLTQMRHPEATNRSLDDDLVAFAMYDIGLEFLIEHHSALALQVDDSGEVPSLAGLFEQKFLLGRDDFGSDNLNLSPLARRVERFASKRFGRIRDCLRSPYESCAELVDFSDGVQFASGFFLHPERFQTAEVDEFLFWINLERFELWDSEPNFLLRRSSEGSVIAYRFFASEKTFDQTRSIVRAAGFEMLCARSGADALYDARFLGEDPRLNNQWIWFIRSPDDPERLAWRGVSSGRPEKFVFESDRSKTDLMLAVGKRRFDSERVFLSQERRLWHERVLFSCHIDPSIAPPNFFGRLKSCLDQLFRSLILRREFVEMLWQGIDINVIDAVLVNAMPGFGNIQRKALQEEILNCFKRVTSNRLAEAGVSVDIIGGAFRFVPV